MSRPKPEKFLSRSSIQRRSSWHRADSLRALSVQTDSIWLSGLMAASRLSSFEWRGRYFKQRETSTNIWLSATCAIVARDAIWSAAAERGGDGALDRSSDFINNRGEPGFIQSGVAAALCRRTPNVILGLRNG